VKGEVTLPRAGLSGDMLRDDVVPLLNMRGIDDNLQDDRRVSKTDPPVLCMQIARFNWYGVPGFTQRPNKKT
jgi:hypothetical protein